MDVSLHRLKLLRDLRHRGTVTAVADALHYSTSAVSQQLALLERETGATLFQRRGRRLVLTEAGELLADHAESILDAVTQAGNAIESLRDGLTATLQVGVWASVASGLFPLGMTSLAARTPGILVRSVELSPEDGSDAVRDGTLDLSFVIDYSNYLMPRTQTLRSHPIAAERMFVAAPAGTFGEEPVALASLATKAWILADSRSHFGRAVRLACRGVGFEPDVHHSVGEQSTALALVGAGLGLSLISELAAADVPDGVELTPVADRFERNLSIVYRSRDAQRPAVRAFLGAMSEAAHTLGLPPPDGPGTYGAPETESPET